MASRNTNAVQGIPIAGEDGKRKKFLNTATGRIEDMPSSQKMVFDTETGKLMAVTPDNKHIALDNRIFAEMDEDGFFVMTTLSHQHDQLRRNWAPMAGCLVLKVA